VREQCLGILVHGVKRQRGRSEREIQHRLLGGAFWYDGGRGMLGGNCPPARNGGLNILRGASMLRDKSNCTVICVVPCELVELIDWMPAMVENSS
jgi:hypothetical protein